MISIEFISNRNSRETRSEWTGGPRSWMTTRSPVRLGICTKESPRLVIRSGISGAAMPRAESIDD
jgi:hypothetical protein